MGQNLASSRCNTGAGFSSMRRTTYSPAALGNHAHARQMTRLEGSKSFRVARAACPTELRAALRGKAAQTSGAQTQLVYSLPGGVLSLLGQHSLLHGGMRPDRRSRQVLPRPTSGIAVFFGAIGLAQAQREDAKAMQQLESHELVPLRLFCAPAPLGGTCLLQARAALGPIRSIPRAKSCCRCLDQQLTQSHAPSNSLTQ